MTEAYTPELEYKCSWFVLFLITCSDFFCSSFRGIPTQNDPITSFSYILFLLFSAIWCLTLDPYPTVTVTRYNSQSFNCSVETSWSAVAYNYDSTNIAWFAVGKVGKCKDFVDQSSGLYTTYCDNSTRTFYLTINNVTDDYNRQTIECKLFYAGNNSQIESLINVQCK